MTDTGKRKVSAREILLDIRSGMGETRLKLKYRLSDRSLESVYRKLVASGALSHEEIPRAPLSPMTPVESLPPDPQSHEWKCPACGASHPVETAECPACGIIVAKFLARQEQVSQPAATMTVSTPTTPNRRLGIASAIGACLVLGLVLLLWPKQQSGEREASARSAAKVKPRSKAEAKPVVLGGRLYDLEYSEEGFPLGLSVSQGFALRLFETPSPEQGFKKFPAETGMKRYYDELSIAGGKYRVITEISNPPQLFLDANGNGDLTDDPGPFVSEGPNPVPNHYSLLLPYKGEKEGVPYRMWLFASRMGGIRFYPKCHWQRMLDINGKSCRLVLFDANSDGDYSNDPLIVDVDGDGKAAATETLRPGGSVDVAGTEVKLIAIAPSGRTVRLDF